MADSNKGKLSVTLGTRVYDENAARWAHLMEKVKQRNPLFDVSKVLRDVLFGEFNVVTDEDRLELRRSEVGDVNSEVGHPYDNSAAIELKDKGRGGSKKRKQS